jgi:carnitine O-octanoyltransferase
MCNRDVKTRLSNRQLLELFKQACNKHDSLMNEARNNAGCDRHLLGLMLISKELNLALPEIFTDEAWKKRFFPYS